MNISKKAIGVKFKLGDTEVIFAVDKKVPHETMEFFISTTIKKVSAQQIIDEC